MSLYLIVKSIILLLIVNILSSIISLLSKISSTGDSTVSSAICGYIRSSVANGSLLNVVTGGGMLIVLFVFSCCFCDSSVSGFSCFTVMNANMLCAEFYYGGG